MTTEQKVSSNPLAKAALHVSEIVPSSLDLELLPNTRLDFSGLIAACYSFSEDTSRPLYQRLTATGLIDASATNPQSVGLSTATGYFKMLRRFENFSNVCQE